MLLHTPLLALLLHYALAHDQANDIDRDNPDVLAYIGNLRMRSSEWGPAQKCFEKILGLQDLKWDGYVLYIYCTVYT
jgi:uncharacterized protein HemY